MPDSSVPASDALTTGLRTYRPKTERYAALAMLWFFPSLGALLILGLTFDTWRKADTFGTALSGTRFEQWIAIVVLSLHPIFLWLERHYRKTEQPVPVPPEKDED